MPYSSILHNSDEWEECPPPTHFLAFSTSTKIFLSAITVGLSVVFFWTLRNSNSHVEHETAKKKRQSLCEDVNCHSVRDAVQAYSQRIQNAIYERTYQPARRRSSKRPLTAEEQKALIIWEREVEQTATERARTSDISANGNIGIGDNATEEFDLPTDAFENESLLSKNKIVAHQQKQQYNDISANIAGESMSTTHIQDYQQGIINKSQKPNAMDAAYCETLLTSHPFDERGDYVLDNGDNAGPLSIDNFAFIEENSVLKNIRQSIEVDDITADDIEFITRSGYNVNNKSGMNKELNMQHWSLPSSDGGKKSLKPEVNKEIHDKEYYDENEQMEKLLLEYETPSATGKNVNASIPTNSMTGNVDDGFNVIYSLPDKTTQNVTLFNTPENNVSYDLCGQSFNAGLQEQQLPSRQNMLSQHHIANFKEVLSQDCLPQLDTRNSYFMEKQMLESKKDDDTGNKKKDQPILHMIEQIEQMPGEASKKSVHITGNATSALIKKNEVYEKNDCIIYDDADDAVTYAPEIQSEEISPDQLSENENTLNLVDNYLERRESPSPKQNLQHQEIYLGQAPINNTTENMFNDTNQKLLSKLDKSNDNVKKRPAPPAMIPLQDIQGSADQQRVVTQKIPKFVRRNFGFIDDSDSVTTSTSKSIHKQSSLMSALGVTSTQEALLKLTSLDELSSAMRRAGLASTNLIFGIDYTASNKYQGEHSFNGLSLHALPNSNMDNPYQQVIKIMGRTLAPFSGNAGIPLFGFGDLTTGDWSVFPLNAETEDGRCRDLDEVLKIYNTVTPLVDLSGPTNFAPLIYRSISICQKIQDYHILVIIADGQVTNERATRKAIVHACQYPLSIIVVGVGDGPWDMMKLFDESLPKRPWDNFHFVEFHKIINSKTHYDRSNIKIDEAKALDFAVHSLLEIPDQYQHICKLKLVQTSSVPDATNQDVTPAN